MVRTSLLFVVLALASAVLSPAAVQAQQEPAAVALTSANIGVVDIARVGAEYTSLLEKNRELETLAQSLTVEIEARTLYPFVTEEEMQELLELLAKAEPTAEEQARAKLLVEESQKREAELLALEGKQEPTDEETSRRSELRAIRNAGSEKVEELRELYGAQLDGQRQRIEAEVVTAVRAAIEEVAGEMALPLVFDKDAILLGGTDITDQVLAKLNAAAPAAEPPAESTEGGGEGGGAAPETPE